MEFLLGNPLHKSSRIYFLSARFIFVLSIYATANAGIKEDSATGMKILPYDGTLHMYLTRPEASKYCSDLGYGFRLPACMTDRDMAIVRKYTTYYETWCEELWSLNSPKTWEGPYGRQSVSHSIHLLNYVHVSYDFAFCLHFLLMMHRPRMWLGRPHNLANASHVF